MKTNNLAKLSVMAAMIAIVSLAATAFAQTGQPPSTPVQPTSWDASGEFNRLANPSYVWTYGSKPSAPCTGTLSAPFATMYMAGAIKGWISAPGSFLGVYQNNQTVPHTAGGVLWPPRAVDLHPGPNGECAVVRFKAPAKGLYTISAHFWAMDPNSTGADVNVYVMYNNASGTTLVCGPTNIAVYGTAPKFTSCQVTGIAMAIGDTIDFAVDPNGSFSFDTTGLHALIELQ